MTLALYVLRAVCARFLAAFVPFVLLWVLLAELGLSRREPLLAGWAVYELTPVLIAYASAPCALAALATSVAGTLAGLQHGHELDAAAAAGIGPLRWLIPLLLLGLVLTAWTWHAVGVLFPAARRAREAQQEALLRSHEVALRVLAADPGRIPGVWVQFSPEGGGSFRDLWVAEIGARSPVIWHAQRGEAFVPEDDGVLQLELEEVSSWQHGADGFERIDARTARLEWALSELSRSRRTSPSVRLREGTLGELRAWIAELPDGELKDRVRADWAARWGWILAPIPVLLGAAAVGLRAGRFGPWFGFLAGLALVALLFLPCHSLCRQWVAKGASPSLLLLPSGLLLALAFPVLRRWSSR